MSNDDDEIAGLIGLGILVLVGVGVYQVVKSLGSYKAGQRITEDEVLAEWIADHDRRMADERRARELAKRVYAYCENCDKETEQCQSTTYHTHSTNRCIPCNNGLGDRSARWCEICDQDAYDNMD